MQLTIDESKKHISYQFKKLNKEGIGSMVATEKEALSKFRKMRECDGASDITITVKDQYGEYELK